MSSDSQVSWVIDGEKYALAALNIQLEGNIPQGMIAPNLWVLTDTRFGFPVELEGMAWKCPG